jgi:SAM-dependent methyltransferase
MIVASGAPRVSYADWYTGLSEYRQRVLDLLEREKPATVCDVGGGAQPSLTRTEVEDNGVEYTLLDISQVELDKAPAEYVKVCLDVNAPLPAGHQRYDLVISHMLAEHVEDPISFHRNIFDLLTPNGVAAHMMPTFYDPAFLANQLLPSRLTTDLVRRAQPERDLGHFAGKFPAYYRWCRGPSRRHIRRFESLGFQVEAMTGYFGTGYLGRVPRLDRMYQRSWVGTLLRHPAPLLTSYCWMVLRRPSDAA